MLIDTHPAVAPISNACFFVLLLLLLLLLFENHSKKWVLSSFYLAIWIWGFGKNFFSFVRFFLFVDFNFDALICLECVLLNITYLKKLSFFQLISISISTIQGHVRTDYCEYFLQNHWPPKRLIWWQRKVTSMIKYLTFPLWRKIIVLSLKSGPNELPYTICRKI